MQRFRARKTKEQLVRRGSPKAASRTTSPDVLDAAGLQCPKDFTPLQAEIWQNYFKLLTINRTLSATDAAALTLFVLTWSEVLELETFLKEHGKTYKITSGREFSRPEVAIRNDARRELRGLMIQLGLTPASRGHVETIKSSSGLMNYGLEKIT